MSTQAVKGVRVPYNMSCRWPLHDPSTAREAFWENIGPFGRQVGCFVEQESPRNNSNVSNAILNGMENAYLECILDEQQSGAGNKVGIGSGLRYNSCVVTEPGFAGYQPEQANQRGDALADLSVGFLSPGNESSPIDIFSLKDIVSPMNITNGDATFEGDDEDLQTWCKSFKLPDMDSILQSINSSVLPPSNDFLDQLLWSQSGNSPPPPSLQKTKIEEASQGLWGIEAIPKLSDDTKFAMINREGQTETLPVVQSSSPLERQDEKTQKHMMLELKNNIKQLKRKRKLRVLPKEYCSGGLGFSESLPNEFGNRGLSPITPHQKLEKLHWQKNQCTSNWLPKPANDNSSNNNSPVQFGSETCLGNVTVDQMNPNEESTEIKVLRQFKSSISNLDEEARLCIRDGFNRLARSVVKRQVSSEMGNLELKSSRYEMEDSVVTHNDENMATSKRSMELETQTNSIDRFIADLLFLKASPSNQGHGTSAL